MTTALISSPRTIRDLIPRAKGENAKAIAIATDIALVVGFALFTAAMAQFEWKLSFTPVPITGQTLAVLLSGATLGLRLGAGSQILYILMGLVFPFYAGGAKGYTENEMVGKVFVQGTAGTFGYLVGFVFAAALIGFLSERKNDRNFVSAIGTFAIGSIIIYSFGAFWLARVYEIPVFGEIGKDNALAWGVYPYIIGDVLKIVLAGIILPGSWMLANKMRKQEADK